jgi:hypothetical protein
MGLGRAAGFLMGLRLSDSMLPFVEADFCVMALAAAAAAQHTMTATWRRFQLRDSSGLLLTDCVCLLSFFQHPCMCQPTASTVVPYTLKTSVLFFSLARRFPRSGPSKRRTYIFPLLLEIWRREIVNDANSMLQLCVYALFVLS